MKVTIAYQCELEDIPQNVFQLLGNVKEHDIEHLAIDVQDAVLSRYIKADTDLRLGIFSEDMMPPPQGTQEVSAQDILFEETGEEKTGD